MDAAWIGINVPKLTVKNLSDAKITATYSFNGGDAKQIEDDDFNFWTGITVERLQEAMKNDGKLTFTYEITWNVSKEENGSKTEGTFTQTIKININAAKLTLTDEREDSEDKDDAEKILWAPSIAKDYKESLPATETEGNKTTEENKKDDVPKTGEVIYCRRKRQRSNSWSRGC